MQIVGVCVCVYGGQTVRGAGQNRSATERTNRDFPECGKTSLCTGGRNCKNEASVASGGRWRRRGGGGLPWRGPCARFGSWREGDGLKTTRPVGVKTIKAPQNPENTVRISIGDSGGGPRLAPEAGRGANRAGLEPSHEPSHLSRSQEEYAKSQKSMQRTDDVASDGKVHLLVVLDVLRRTDRCGKRHGGGQAGRGGAGGSTGQLSALSSRRPVTTDGGFGYRG